MLREVNRTLPLHLEFSSTFILSVKMSAFMRNRVSFCTGYSAITGGLAALAISGVSRIDLAILSVTIIKFSDSTPMPTAMEDSLGSIILGCIPLRLTPPDPVQPANIIPVDIAKASMKILRDLEMIDIIAWIPSLQTKWIK